MLTTAKLTDCQEDLTLHFLGMDPCLAAATDDVAGPAAVVVVSAAAADVVASIRLVRAEAAFEGLALRGWRCGMPPPRGSSRVAFCVQALRASAPLPKAAVEALRRAALPVAGGGSSGRREEDDGDSDDAMVGSVVSVLAAAPFGVSSRRAPAVLETQGLLANASRPPGLLLLDAQRLESPAGSAVLLRGDDAEASPAEPARLGLVALLVPPLESASKEAVAFCLALPLGQLARALLQGGDLLDAAGLRLSEAERAALARCMLHGGGGDASTAGAAAVPRSLVWPPRGDARRRAPRQGVALLWLASTGSWASGVVVSEAGHILTCAHFLTGTSWMEEQSGGKDAQPSDRNKSSSASVVAASAAGARAASAAAEASAAAAAVAVSSPLPLPPKRPSLCKGRAQVRDRDGRNVEVTFEADVLYVSEGFLDVALVLVQASSCRPVGGPLDVAAAVAAAAAAAAGRSSGGPPYTFLPLPWSAGAASLTEGTDVLAVGHGLFGPGTPFKAPSVSRGHLAVVARGAATGRPAVVQSSAPVHRGCSGGALVVEAPTGCSLLGLVTTNVRRHVDGQVLPRVNFSLPVELLAPLRSFLAAPSREGSLAELVEAWSGCAADEQERGLWCLAPEPLDLPSREQARKQLALAKLQELAREAEATELVKGRQPERPQASAKGTAGHPLVQQEVLTRRAAL